MAVEPVVFELAADTGKAEEDVESFFDSIGSKIAPTVDLLGALELAWGGVSDAIGFATDLLLDSIEASLEGERTERQLTAALAARGKETEATTRHLLEFNNALEKSTNVSAESLTEIQAQALALGVLPSRLEEVTEATVGWSALMGKDLNSALRDVLASLEGKLPKSLSKLRPEVDTTREALAFMASGLTQAEAAADSTEGRLQALSIALGNVQENLGATITSSTEFRGLLGDLVGTVEEVGEEASKRFESAKSGVDDFFGALRSGLDWLKSNKGTIASLFNDAFNIAAFSPAGAFARIPADIKAILSSDNPSFVGSFVDRLHANERGFLDTLLGRGVISVEALSAGDAAPNWGSDEFTFAQEGFVGPLQPKREKKSGPKARKARGPDEMDDAVKLFHEDQLRRVQETLNLIDAETELTERQHELWDGQAKFQEELSERKRRDLEMQRIYAREGKAIREDEIHSISEFGSLLASNLSGIANNAQHMNQMISGELGSIFMGLGSALGSGLAAALAALVEGGEKLGEELAGIAANIFNALGAQLLSMAAVLGILSIFNPGLAPIAGSMAAAGAAAVVAGAVIKRAASGGSASAPSGGGGGFSAPRRSSAGFGSFDNGGSFASSRRAAGGDRVVNVNVAIGYGAVITDSRRQLGAALSEILSDYGTLSPVTIRGRG